MFCKYQITPQRGIDFGPVTYNTTSKPKTFDIVNTGEFAYDFALKSYGEAPSEPRPGGGKKADAKDAKKGGAAGGSITVGQFTCEPASGRIEPGARAVRNPHRAILSMMHCVHLMKKYRVSVLHLLCFAPIFTLECE